MSDQVSHSYKTSGKLQSMLQGNKVPSGSRLNNTVNLILVEHPLKIQSKNRTVPILSFYSTDDLSIDPPLHVVEPARHV